MISISFIFSTCHFLETLNKEPISFLAFRFNETMLKNPTDKIQFKHF